MASTLQKTLRDLCCDTGWCYAVFWKLKRQMRTVLTWEDGFYEPFKSSEQPVALSSGFIGQQVSPGRPAHFDDRIGLAVARMSYHVYSVGEGVIGRVAFTNKHQWIFSSSDKVATAEGSPGSKRSRRTQPEYPTGWQDQFSAGVKTISVIAVPQGVVQLGSTQTISEDLKFVGHVKALFGTLQTVPGVYLSDLVTESQRGEVHGLHSMAMPLAQLPLTATTTAANVRRIPGVSDVWSSFAAAGKHFSGSDGVGRLPTLKASQQIHLPSQSSPLPGVLGFQENNSVSPSTPLPVVASHQLQSWPLLSSPLPVFLGSQGHAILPQNSLLHKLGSDLLVQPSSPPSSEVTVSGARAADMIPVKADFPSRTGIISHLPLTTKLPNMAWPPADTLSAISCPPLPTGSTSQMALTIEPSFAGGGGIGSPSSGMSQSPAQNMPVPSADVSNASLNSSGSAGLVARKGPLPNGDMMSKNQANLFSLVEKSSSSGGSTCNALDSHFDVQMSDLLQLAQEFENADNHAFREPLSLKNISLRGQKDPSGLLCEENMQQSLESVFEKSCLDVLSDDGYIQNVFSTELDDFDDFIASLTREQERQTGSVSTSRPAGLIVLEEGASEASKKSPQKASFWDPLMMQGSLQPSLAKEQAVTTLPAILPAILSKPKDETSMSCKKADSNDMHAKMPKLESPGTNLETDTKMGCQLQALVLPASKQDETLKVGRKRARPGENARPRPKDRQQIQDRVHELRDIIPSSAKCSIDALLEKTIKYMNFLQTVTQEAGKWKPSSKLQDGEGNGGSNVIEGGASWAVELGGQGRGCPIIVENLSQPGQLLVEMLCEEKGIFLEIADSIRGLGLTILKGVMEVRNNKIWARFVVKAVQDVHRVQVLWSLMELLESTNTRTSSNVTNPPCG